MNLPGLRRWFLIIAAGILLACQLPLLGSKLPEVVDYPAPELETDFSPFEQAGCQKDEYGWIRCPDDSPISEMGCGSLQKASDLLGGLRPGDPIAVCVVRPPDDMDYQTFDQQESVYRIGGLFPTLYRYVIWRDEEFQLLENKQAVRQAFAPIEGQDEALSYAIALTNLEAYYDLQAERGMRYFTNRLEDTHVLNNSAGYEINLFHYQFLGCGPHPTSQVIVQVSRDGDILLGDAQKLFEDPEQDDLCVD
jgi:hypothetical protein